jgi:hypothetical protein
MSYDVSTQIKKIEGVLRLVGGEVLLSAFGLVWTVKFKSAVYRAQSQTGPRGEWKLDLGTINWIRPPN